MNYLTWSVIGIILALAWGAPASATYKDDIGYTQLAHELGSQLPTAAGVKVSQIEANGGGTGYYSYMPNPSGSEFTGKTITPTLGNPPTYPYTYSSHATSVGNLFYGKYSSIAPGITDITSYLADYWLDYGFLNTTWGVQPASCDSRVGNHSWVGYADDPAINSEILRRLDWVIERDEYIQVVAMNNGSSNQPLLGSSFNSIAVGLSNVSSANGSYALDSPYGAGRTRPDIVAPMTYTSYATPVVASATALLVQKGHDSGLSLSRDPLVNSTTNRNGDTIYNSERSEVVKAAIMAGGDRTKVSGYTVNTANGLDSRYGAGQLNIYNSYHIIAAGEQNSKEDAASHLGMISNYGFDYDPYFGGLSGSNTTGSYYFHTSGTGTFAASLVWNLNVNGGTLNNFDGTATLYHLYLSVYDVSNPLDPVLLIIANSLLDNTENIWTSLSANRDYLLQVQTASGPGAFLWDYALAWDIAAPVPLPGTAGLLGAGLLALAGWGRRLRGSA